MSGALQAVFMNLRSFGNPPTSVDYLVIGGGGGGGLNGGGGAGGYLTGSVAVASGTPITITVGGGGQNSAITNFGGKVGLVFTNPGSGSQSVIYANSTIVASGGGAGGRFIPNVIAGNASLMRGSNGGSGGGAGGYTTYFQPPVGKTPGFTVTVNQGGSGTSGQGNAGGNGINSPATTDAVTLGGGGGGASAAGASGSGTGLSRIPGAGGNGSASSITGSSITYAGGGGGGWGQYNASTTNVTQANRGTGGTGGGGGGGYYVPPYSIGKTNYPAVWTSGDNGSANYGGGGGAGLQQSGITNSGRNGGGGGSGYVVIRYPDTFTAASATTGSVTVTVTGGYRIYAFAGTGTITF
jgi:hypothetical protein